MTLASANSGFGTIWTHYDVSHYLGGTDHVDPIAYLAKWGYNTTQFLDLVKAHYNNKQEFNYFAISNRQTLNKQGTLSEANRADGLYAAGPYHTSMQTMHANASAKAYNGQVVTVIGSAKTKLGTYMQIRLKNGKTYWIDAKGISFYDVISHKKTVNATATLAQSTRSDGLYAGGPYRTSAATQHAVANAKPYNGKSVKVVATATTVTAKWYEIVLNGKTYWIDSRGLSNVKNYYVISNVKAANYPALIQEAKRNDSLYAAGPYRTSAATMKAEGSARVYNNQKVRVLKTAKTATGTWAQIRLSNNTTHWMSLKGLREITDVTSRRAYKGSAILNQSKRNDGLYAGGPYLTSLTTLKAKTTAKRYNNQRVEILGSAKTSLANWIEIKLRNGKTYWIDSRGLKDIDSYDSISNQRTVNKTMFLNQDVRDDGLYTSGPRNTSLASEHAKLTAKRYNHQTVKVLATAKTILANWTEIKLNNGKVYWIDSRGVLDFLPVTNKHTVDGTAVLAQSTRNDGLYSTTPYLSSAAAMHAVTQGRRYNRQKVHVLATAKNSLTSWTQIRLSNGRTYWIDSRGLSNVETYDKISNYAKLATPKLMVLSQNSRNDGLYASGPRRTNAASMHAVANGVQYNQQSVSVLATAKTNLANWSQIRLRNGKVYWVDSRALASVASYDHISNYIKANKRMVLRQATRNDGLYVSGPRRTSAASMHAVATAKPYNGQSVQVLATAKTILANWAEIRLSNGKVYWIDQRGLGTVSPVAPRTPASPLAGLTLNGVNATQKAFLSRIIPAAISVGKANGLYPSVIVAQAITESGWGSSELATRANNYFGIKADATWHGAVYRKASKEWANGRLVSVTSNFRKYANAQAGISGYATKILTSPYYQGTLRKNAPSGVAAAAGLRKWATDPSYTTKIAQKIKTYNFSALDRR